MRSTSKTDRPVVRWIAAVASLIGVAFAFSTLPAWGAGSMRSGVAFARVDLNPAAVAVYPAKHTIYSANNARNDLSIVNGARCKATNTSECSRMPPRQDVGVIPSAIAINQRTNTAYVANNTETASGSVSVVNLLRCNATSTTHCTHFPRLPPAVRLPFDPSDIAVNERTNTVYADGADHRLAVIDARHCNGTTPRGCRRALHIGRVAAGAGGVAINPKTDTVYTVSYFSGLVSVINGRTCRAGNTSGCGRTLATVRVGRHPFRLTVDAATNTVYVTNFGAGTVSVIGGAACDAATTSGCDQPPAVIHVGREPEALAIDDANHLGFVTNAGNNTVSVFDAARCQSANTTGCATRPPTVRVGALPNGIAIDQHTATVYVANNASDTLAVFKAALPN